MLGGAALVTVVALVGGVLPIVAAHHYGALGIPRGDDWSYLLTTFRFEQTGHLTFNNWVSMTLVGQVLLALPLAAATSDSTAAMQGLTAVLGVAGLLAGVWMARRFVPLGWALLIAGCIAVSPLWGPLAGSFMTDVPTFAVSVIAMALAVEGLRHDPVRLGPVVAGLAVGLFAFTMRQYAVVPVAAIALAAGWRLAADGDRRRLRTLVWLTAVFAVLAVAFYLWWRSIPDAKPFEPSFPDAHSLKVVADKTAGYLRLTGLVLAPLVVFANPMRIVRRAWNLAPTTTVVTGGTAALYVVGMSLRLPRGRYVGNYVSLDGALSRDVLLGRRPDLLPSTIADIVLVAATVSALVIVVAAVPALVALGRRVRERDVSPPDGPTALLGLGVLGYAAAYELAMFTGVPVYDRYLLPVLPLVGILFVRSATRAPAAVGQPGGTARNRARPFVLATGALTFAALAVVGLAYTLDSASFDGTRWQVAAAAASRGFSPREVNGGFEWVNWHRGRKEPRRRGPATRVTPEGDSEQPGEAGVSTRISAFCVNVAVNPVAKNLRIIASAPYPAFTRDDAVVVAVRTNRPCRPASRSASAR